MAKQIVLELPDTLYEQAQELAAQQKQELAIVLTDLLNDALNGQAVAYSEPDPDVQREMDAYLEMYPRLVTDYLGKFVAIYHGELIDEDSDFSAIMRRVESKYPKDFVLVKQVESVRIRTITVRSPHFVSGM